MQAKVIVCVGVEGSSLIAETLMVVEALSFNVWWHKWYWPVNDRPASSG